MTSEFQLTPPEKRRGNKKWKPLPESILLVHVAPPHQELITVRIKVLNKRDQVEWITYVWSPAGNKNKIKKVHGRSWKDLGVGKDVVARIKLEVIRQAKADHLRRVKDYSTLRLDLQR